MERPKLNRNISIEDFRDFYWLKEELLSFCREHKINSSGGKIQISERIAEFLLTGAVTDKKRGPVKTKSKFDWKKEELSLNTVITDNYRNTTNVREFFKKEIGANFKFNTEFMDWMKANAGKTLANAVVQWKYLKGESKNRTAKADIAPQFEYNTYIRDFMADNPKHTFKDAIKYWKIKKAKSGSNKYHKNDLSLK